MKEVRRGQIFLADLNPVKGREQGGYRPVLVLQKDILNRNLNTVVVAPITKKLKAKGLLTTWFLAGRQSGLKLDSVVLLYQLRTIDRRRLVKKVSELDAVEMAAVREQLMFVV